MIKKFLKWFNKNPYIYAVLMILLNFGSKYIEKDLHDSHKRILSSTMMRRLLLFTVIFIATKDVMVSLIMTAVFIVFVLNLFNPKSNYCILPPGIRKLDTNKDGKISPEEIKAAHELLKRAGKLK